MTVGIPVTRLIIMSGFLYFFVVLWVLMKVMCTISNEEED